MLIVPTLCVGMHARTLRVHGVTPSVTNSITTRSVGTIGCSADNQRCFSVASRSIEFRFPEMLSHSAFI
jgi:hypothetical protein